MTSVVKKRVGLMMVLILLMLSAFCGCKSAEDKLVGRWELVEGNCLRNIEFFSDNTFSATSWSGIYSIDGNRIKLETVYMGAWLYTFELDGSRLSLEGDSGSSGVYEKIN